MGRGIAQLFAAGGFNALIFDLDEGLVGDAIAHAASMLERDASKGKINRDAAVAGRARLKPASTIKALSSADIFIEAIVEEIAAKREFITALEATIAPSCVIATNTSSSLVTANAAHAKHPGCICGMHFFNPVPLMKVVEIIGGARTRTNTIQTAKSFVAATGHAAVVAGDMPGFLVNHAGRGLYTEGLRIVSEGIAAIDDVDLVMRESAGFRMGPFELLDLTGLDVSYKVTTQIYHQFFEDPRYRPQPLAARQYAAGLHGRKVIEGFYRYVDGKAVVSPKLRPMRSEARPVWMASSLDEYGQRVRDRLNELGINLKQGDVPDAGSIILVAPVGNDAMTTAVMGKLDPERTVAIDPLFCESDRITFMTTPVTRPEYRDSACNLLTDAGLQVTSIHDSPGFIAQRVIAMIVNIGCDMAQQRIASPKDIEIGVKLGLGYPAGPLGLGDRIGSRTILTILERMFAFYGDPRYRPSPWLKRRATLGCPLTTEEV